MDRTTARDLASRHRIPLDVDFHTLRACQVEDVIAAADEHGYRKPANANGSRGRYFHAALVKAASRET